jgi:hypothetical protein
MNETMGRLCDPKPMEQLADIFLPTYIGRRLRAKPFFLAGVSCGPVCEGCRGSAPHVAQRAICFGIEVMVSYYCPAACIRHELSSQSNS